MRMDTFLRVNRNIGNRKNLEIYTLVQQLAQGTMNKQELANYLEQNVIPKNM